MDNKRMEIVEPLRTNNEIQDILYSLRNGTTVTRKKKEELAERDVLLFLIGINTGLRVSDIVKLKVKDVRGKDSFVIYEGKTKKRRVVNISMLRDEISRYTNNKDKDSYLFKSQKSDKPITTTQVYRILQNAGEHNARNDIGTHTMRKTFGYHHYKQNKDIAILQEIFNHSSPAITKRYIGIRQDEIDETLNNFRLG